MKIKVRFLAEILAVENFASTGIQTPNLPTQWFFIVATLSLQAQPPSGLYSWAPTGSQYSGRPSQLV